MKHIKTTVTLWLLCLFTVLPMGATAQRTMTYSVNFSPSEFTIKKINGDTSVITSSKYDIYSNYDPTQPELPVIYVTFLLPPDMVYDSFTYTKTETAFADSILLTNGKLPACTDQESKIQKEWYPPKIYHADINFSKTYSFGRYRLACFVVHPFTYNAISGKIGISSFSLKISCNFNSEITDIIALQKDDFNREYISKLIYNEDLLYLYGNLNERSITINDTTQYSGYDAILTNDYIVITSENLINSFKPLIDYKKRKGLLVKTFTVEWIASHFSGSSLAYKIKKCIMNNIDSDAPNHYVLLGGDATIIPAVFGEAPETPKKSETPIIPCDSYYGVLEGDLDWNPDNEGIRHPMNSSNVSFNLNAYVGRCPVNTSTEVATFCNKVIQYEKKPPLTGWSRNYLFCGSSIGNDNVNGTYFGDSDFYAREIISRIHQRDSLCNASILFETSSSLYNTVVGDEMGNSYIDNGRLSEQLQNNYSIVCECSHGENNLWELGCFNYTTDYTLNFVQQISTDIPKIVVSGACHSNSFDKSSFMGRTFMNSDSSGVVAYIGNSRQGYVDGDPVAGVFKLWHVFANNFFQGLYEETNQGHIGKIFSAAKYVYMNTSEPYNNWLYYVINLLGDPEMPIYTGEIKQFHNAESIIYNDSLIISTGGVEDVFFAVNEPNNNMLYETRITSIHESDTIYVLETEEDSIQVALMKWNHVPRLFDIESHYYIQNRPNYNGDTKYENRTRPYLSIGRDVTNLKQFGNVNLVSGKTYSFKAKKEIQIKNGFSCPSGVGFTLDISNE